MKVYGLFRRMVYDWEICDPRAVLKGVRRIVEEQNVPAFKLRVFRPRPFSRTRRLPGNNFIIITHIPQRYTRRLVSEIFGDSYHIEEKSCGIVLTRKDLYNTLVALSE